MTVVIVYFMSNQKYDQDDVGRCIGWNSTVLNSEDEHGSVLAASMHL